MIVRYDPRNLSRIHLLGPDGRYYDIPYRDLRRPPITLWEQRLALKRLREEGRSHVDESAIFRTIETMRRIAEEAVSTTKTLRRQQERRLRLIQGGRGDPSISATGNNTQAIDLGDDDQENLRSQCSAAPLRGVVVSKDYPHLHDSVRSLAAESDESRIRRIRADRWVAYARADAALSAFEDLLTFPKRTRMPNLLLCGPTNNGESR